MCICVELDETLDSCGHYIAHLLIGMINGDCQTNAYLFSFKQLEQMNNNTVCYSLSSERLVDIKIIKFYVEKIVNISFKP
jgi:hypothetical protein